jgi:monofunctional glycosyltransferase
MPPSKKKVSNKVPQTRASRFFRIAKKVLKWYFIITIGWVLVCRFLNPPFTVLMVLRGIEGVVDGKGWKLEKEWRNYDELSTNLKRAAIGGEDANFASHYGFDFKSIQKAYLKNKSGKPIRGGSTISQQTAKNVFLWPGRSYIRKAFEAYFTVLIEIFWSKERILEVYLNVAV